jgi:peptide/nickel transport system substrate-binding protein
MLLFSCNENKKHIDDKHVFRYNEAAGITSLDPAFSRTFENLWAVNQLFEGLVQLDDEMNVIPAIAKSWKISEDGLTYMFTIRNDVYFHSNDDFKKRKVLAKDFSYSFNRIIDEKTASPGKWVFNKVVKNGFIAVNDSTLLITLKEAFPPFLSILSMKYCSVVPKEVVQQYGEEFRSKPIGTGPFVFKFWEENQVLSLLKNPNYYVYDAKGEQLPYLKAISITFKKDQNAVFLDFLKGSYDMLQGIEGNYKEELLDENGVLRSAYETKVLLVKSPWLKTDYLGFLLDSIIDGKANPLNNINIRLAINHAIDRTQMSKILLRNLASPAFGGFIPEGFESHTNRFDNYSYDPGIAMSLLKMNGYSVDKPLLIDLNTTVAYAALAEFIQHQLGLVGIKLNVNVLEAGNLNELVAQSNLLFFKKSWLADYPDEENFMALFYSKNFCPDGPNYTHYKSDVYDSLYEKSFAELDKDKRMLLYQQMDSLVANEQAIVPIFYGQAIKFLQIGINGLPNSPVNMLDLRKVQKK